MMYPEYLKSYRPTFKQYLESRKQPGIPNARSALHNAKYRLYRSDLLRRWSDAGGDIVDSYDSSEGWEAGESRVRIVAIPDCCYIMEDLKGDCFNPRVNSNINPNRLTREEREFEDRVARDGVWGFRAEYWNGSGWIETDSIFGFVGDDFIGSGYDDHLMESSLGGLSDCLAAEARLSEAMRPDMYFSV